MVSQQPTSESDLHKPAPQQRGFKAAVSPDYRVALDVYSGPMDLLLYLIRRDEIDIYDIPIARITEQYVAYVALLGKIDPEIVSEFLVLAATLMEIKSRTLLPRPPVDEGEEDMSDPRLELVQQLLAYKKFKDAARSLEDAAEVRSQRHARSPVLPSADPNDMELDNLDIWTLYEAFRKLLEQIGKGGGVHKVGVDDTPVALHAEDILDSIERAGGSQAFEQVFAGRTRPEMIGLFLALLELIRQRRVRVMQDRPFGTILVTMLDRRPLDAVPDETADRGITGPFGAVTDAVADAETVAHSIEEIEESDRLEEESEESELTLISSAERERGEVEWPAEGIVDSAPDAAEEPESSPKPDSLRGIPNETE